MASDINSVIIVGRLVRDSEIKSTNGGTSVARFSLAVNRVKGSSDKRETEVSYIDCVLWGKSAETLAPYLTKGKQVSVQGELRQNRWEQDGQQRSRIEIVVTQLQLLGSKDTQAEQVSSNYGERQSEWTDQTGLRRQPVRSAQAAPSQRQASPAPRYSDPAPSGGPESYDSDEIPF